MNRNIKNDNPFSYYPNFTKKKESLSNKIKTEKYKINEVVKYELKGELYNTEEEALKARKGLIIADNNLKYFNNDDLIKSNYLRAIKTFENISTENLKLKLRDIDLYHIYCWKFFRFDDIFSKTLKLLIEYLELNKSDLTNAVGYYRFTLAQYNRKKNIDFIIEGWAAFATIVHRLKYKENFVFSIDKDEKYISKSIKDFRIIQKDSNIVWTNNKETNIKDLLSMEMAPIDFKPKTFMNMDKNINISNDKVFYKNSKLFSYYVNENKEIYIKNYSRTINILLFAVALNKLNETIKEKE